MNRQEAIQIMADYQEVDRIELTQDCKEYQTAGLVDIAETILNWISFK